MKQDRLSELANFGSVELMKVEAEVKRLTREQAKQRRRDFEAGFSAGRTRESAQAAFTDYLASEPSQ